MSSHLPLRAAFIALLLLLCSWAGAQPQPAEAPPEAEQLLDRIQQLSSEYRALEQQEGQLEGGERAAVTLQMRNNLLEFMRQVDELVGFARPVF